jgi:hypothetical protein
VFREVAKEVCRLFQVYLISGLSGRSDWLIHRLFHGSGRYLSRHHVAILRKRVGNGNGKDVLTTKHILSAPVPRSMRRRKVERACEASPEPVHVFGVHL